MRTSTILISVFASFISLTACGPTSASDDDSDQLDAPVGKADGASVPGGAYTNSTPLFGELSTLSLNDDHSFTLTQLQACAGGGTCAPAQLHGHYLLTHSTTTSNRYVRLYADDNSDLGRYQWKLTSGNLKLRNTEDDSTTFFVMDKGATCDSAGGSCVALTPSTCQGGTVGDATEYSCGGGDGVECCLPAQADSCSADTDCSGLVPEFCRMCSDGSEACAHWSCVENACAIVSCQ